MRILFLAIFCCFASHSFLAQSDIDFPYNPDFENDGFVGIEDVLELLSVYGTPFTPEQLLLDGASLTEIIESLQSQIDSLASYTNEGFGAIALNDSLLTEYLVGVAAASEEGDSTLGAWVMQLSEVVEQQQAQLDSLLQIHEESTGLFLGNTVHYEFADLDWVVQSDGGDNGTLLIHEVNFNTDGFLHIQGEGILSWIIIEDSIDYSQYSNQNLAHANFNTYTETLSPYFTLVLKKDEKLVLYTEVAVLDNNHYLGRRDLFWTPVEQSSTNLDEPGQDVQGPCQGEFTVNYHGYDYELVEIGDQCWFAENLRTTSYRNGEVISNENSYLESSSEAWNELNQLSPLVDGEEGHFYSLGVIQSGLDICPSGWSVPSRNDWIHLAAEIDLSLGGHFLKDSTSWNGVDTYGFGAKPTGRAFYQGYDPDWDWAYECSGAMYYQQWYQELESLLQYADECDNGNVPEGCLTFYDGINETLDSLEESGLVNFEPSLLPLSSVEDLEFLLYDGGASLTQPCGSYEEAIELFYGGFDYSYQLVEVGQSTSWWARDASAGTYNSGNVRLDGSTRINGLDSQVDGGLGMNISIRCVKD